MTMEKRKVLVVAKTEPAKSRKYGASICTAGITEEGEFIRLYPVPYWIFDRKEHRFRKYDIIEVMCEKSKRDQRPESYRVDPESIRVIDHIDTNDEWVERNRRILPLVSDGLTKLNSEGRSLGIIKAYRPLNLQKKLANDDEMKELSMIQTAFSMEDNELRIIPPVDTHKEKFVYSFRCIGDDGPHNIMCEDWEIYQAYRRWTRIYGNDAGLKALENKFLTEFGNEKDLHFFVGTHNRWKTWMIIGIYYPPKNDQCRLFNF